MASEKNAHLEWHERDVSAEGSLPEDIEASAPAAPARTSKEKRERASCRGRGLMSAARRCFAVERRGRLFAAM